MATRRIVITRSSIVSSPTTLYDHLEMPVTWAAGSIAASENASSIVQTVSNLKFQLTVAPGGGTSHTFTLIKNGVATLLQVVISGSATTGSDIANAVSVAVGDKLCWERVAGGGSPATTDVRMTFEMDGSASGESCYFSAFGNQNTVLEYFHGLFRCPQQTVFGNNWNGTRTNVENVASAPGTLNQYRIRLVAAPGVSKSWTYTLYKNGVKQDGSGGTPNTQFVIQDGGTESVSPAFSLSVAAGDQLAVSSVPSGTPTNSGGVLSVAFTATTDGESQFVFAGSDAEFLDAAATEYRNPMFDDELLWNATETSVDGIGGITTFTLSKFYVRLNGSPGGAASYTLTQRKNNAGTALAVVLSAAETADNNVADTVSITSADTLAIQCVPSGTPTARFATMCMTQFATPTAPTVAYLITVDPNAVIITRAAKRCLALLSHFDTGPFTAALIADALLSPARETQTVWEIASNDNTGQPQMSQIVWEIIIGPGSPDIPPTTPQQGCPVTLPMPDAPARTGCIPVIPVG